MRVGRHIGADKGDIVVADTEKWGSGKKFDPGFIIFDFGEDGGGTLKLSAFTGKSGKDYGSSEDQEESPQSESGLMATMGNENKSNKKAKKTRSAIGEGN